MTHGRIAPEGGRSSNHGPSKYICDLRVLDAPLSRGMTSQRLVWLECRVWRRYGVRSFRAAPRAQARIVALANLSAALDRPTAWKPSQNNFAKALAAADRLSALRIASRFCDRPASGQAVSRFPSGSRFSPCRLRRPRYPARIALRGCRRG